MTHIAFIGTGTMGQFMAAHLLKAGHQLTLFSRTRSKAESLLNQGAQWADSAAAAAAGAQVIISMVGTPDDVRNIYFDGILHAASPGAILIDMTTSSPQLAQDISHAAHARGLQALDAPVTGGPQGAESGKLIIMVGGEASVLECARPILSLMGETLLHYGPSGHGQRAKLVNQTVGMLNMLSAIEGVFFARKAGLDTEQMLQMLQAGLTDSKSLRGVAPRALKGDFAPNFHPAHVIKDLTLAIQEADALGLDLPMLKAARERWVKLLQEFPQARAVHEVARLYM
jgi:3-hydroxyisobutyrate dehydrogenase